MKWYQNNTWGSQVWCIKYIHQHRIHTQVTFISIKVFYVVNKPPKTTTSSRVYDQIIISQDKGVELHTIDYETICNNCYSTIQSDTTYAKVCNIHFISRAPEVSNTVSVISVKVQFRGPELYKKKGAIFQEESYLSRIFRFSSLNLHTFHLIHIVFW